MQSGGKGKEEVEEEEEEETGEEVEGKEDVWLAGTILHFLSVRKVGGEDSVGAPAAGWCLLDN